MSLNLPRSPDPGLINTDPAESARQIGYYHDLLGQKLERQSLQTDAPAKAPFAVTNIPAPTTTLVGPLAAGVARL